ncbi:hypothetical protein BGZ59_007611, partial [Podila verticillata]
MSEAAREFRAVFDPEKQSIEAALSGLDQVPKTEIQAAVDSLVQRIHALERTVTEKITILPAHDARVCLEAVKSMSERLSQLRVKLIPKQKFSFKSRKSASASPSPAPASPSPRPSTPKRSIDQSLFMKFEDRTGEHLFIGSLPVPSDESGAAKDVALTNLTNCTVNLVHNIPLGAIHIKNLKQCTLVIPPVSGSILLHDCEGCTLIGACHQSRMHTSNNMDIYLHVTSEPIIEDCTDMRFAPYGQVLPSEQLDRLFEVAQLDQTKNFYDHVKDFNWLRQQQSPNWRVLDATEVKPDLAQRRIITAAATSSVVTAATNPLINMASKIPPHHTLTSLSITHVQFVQNDILSKLLAYVTLSPLAILCGYVGAILTGRDLKAVVMLGGQLLNEVVNQMLKRLVKQARPTEYLGDGYGMPSSHSQFMAYFATYMVILMYR